MALKRSWYAAAEAGWRNPITGIADCCARATSGQAVAAAPRSDMNSRRFMRFPEGNGSQTNIAGRGRASQQNRPEMSALGQQQTKRHEAVMSALPPKADIATLHAKVGGIWLALV
jgi:hypothetical protein